MYGYWVVLMVLWEIVEGVWVGGVYEGVLFCGFCV